MAKGAGAQSTTRRTLHYYWWATRRHLGLYIGMIVSTISFGVLLSYGNPLVMSLIVARGESGYAAHHEHQRCDQGYPPLHTGTSKKL